MPAHKSPLLTGLLVAAVAAAVVSGPAAPVDAQGAGDDARGPDRATVDAAVWDDLAGDGEVTVMVHLRGKADLSAASTKRGHGERVGAVRAKLMEHAERTQAGLRAMLDRKGVDHDSFWISDALRVTVDAGLVDELAKRPEVAEIVVEPTYDIPETDVADATALTQAVEWGIDRINAPQVWDEFGTRGEGVVIGGIDSGVQYDHPVLAGSYRGNLGSDQFSHDYNWYDPSGVCPTTDPCDNDGHGTHTMGTSVGGEGIGVAPGATWIAAKGCATRSCFTSDLLLAGEWMLAPTDSAGNNPRPELAPHVINNSWGGGRNDLFYADMITAWKAAGIFPVFSVGNDGPACGTATSPGDNAGVYSVGSHGDFGNRISLFSSRGPAINGETNPSITAPGGNVRSATPGNTYSSMNGTSMAAPHVTGTVALLWSAAPSLVGDLAATESLLDGTAVDVPDDQCGGTDDDNNVYGEGRLDAHAAVTAAPRADTGSIQGAVVSADGGEPIANARVTATTGDQRRRVVTTEDGSYTMRLPAGTWTVTVSAYGHAPVVEDRVVVTAGTDLARDFELVAASFHEVTGQVLDVRGEPLASASVRVGDTPLDPVTTDADGRYRFEAVAQGTWPVVASPTAPVLCNGVQSHEAVVDGPTVVDFQLPSRTDNHGYACMPTSVDWVNAKHDLDVHGDEGVVTVDLPFSFPFYGADHDRVHVTANGLLNFLQPRLGDWDNEVIPGAGVPNGAIYAYWDDLVVNRQARVQTAEIRRGGRRAFVVEWEKVALAADPGTRLSFQAILDEAGDVTLQYRDFDRGGQVLGDSATIGMENASGTDGFRYAVDEQVLQHEQAISFIAPETPNTPADQPDAAATADGRNLAADHQPDVSNNVAPAVTDDAAGADGDQPAGDGDSSTATSQSGTELPADAAMELQAVVETVRGAATVEELAGGGKLLVHAGGVITRLDDAGDTVWQRANLSLRRDWEISPLRPWQTDPFPANVLIQRGSASDIHLPVTPRAHATGDLTGDGVPDVAFAASVGASPYQPFIREGSDLNTGTFVTVLDGVTGDTLWTDLYPSVTQVHIQQDTLVFGVPTGLNFQTPIGDTSTLHGMRFADAGDGTLTVDAEWTHDTGNRRAEWMSLTAVDGESFAVAWAERGLDGPEQGHVLVLDAATGQQRWTTSTPMSARHLAVDATRDVLVAAEQELLLDRFGFIVGGNHELTTYNLATGDRTVVARRVNALPLDLAVGDVAGSDEAHEYVVSEAFFDRFMALNTNQVRVVDGDGTEVWATTDKRSSGPGTDGPRSHALAVHERTIVAAHQPLTAAGLAANRSGVRYGNVLALRGSDGAVAWHQRGIAASPANVTVTEAGAVVTVSGDQTLHSYDVANGRAIDTVPLLADMVDVVAADVNADGTADLVVAGESHGVFALDGTSLGGSRDGSVVPRQLWRTSTAGAVQDLSLADTTGDDVPEVVVAATDAAHVLDLASGDMRATIEGDTVMNVTAADLDGSPGAEVVVPTDAVRAYDARGRQLWSWQPPEDVRFGNVVVADGAVFAHYNELGSFHTPDIAAQAVALQADTGEVRWAETPATTTGQLRLAQLHNGVVAAPSLPYADGHAVVFTFSQGEFGTVAGDTLVDVRDGRTGERVAAFTNGGLFTHRNHAVGPEGVLQARMAAMSLYDADGGETHLNLLPVPMDGTLANGPAGSRLAVTANQGDLQAWDIGVFDDGRPYPRAPLDADLLGTGRVEAVDLDDDGVDELIAMPADLLGLDTALDFSGAGYVPSDPQVPGLLVFELTTGS